MISIHSSDQDIASLFRSMRNTDRRAQNDIYVPPQMTEFWQSKKQYYCKYCLIFIRDDAPSRTQHETGFRHQGNKERFLREIYKTGERAVRDKEEERRVMERIDKAANEAHSAATAPPPTTSSSTSFTSTPQPLASSSKLPSTSSASASPDPTAKPSATSGTKGKLSSSDPYANYSSAASLGYVDKEAIEAEKAAALAAERSKVGTVGGWETVAVHTSTPAVGIADTAQEEEDERYALNGLSDPDAIDRFRHRNAINALHGVLGTDEITEAKTHDFSSSSASDSRTRPTRTVEDDDWDPELALRGKVKVREETIMQRREREEAEERVKKEDLERRGLREDRKGWGGVVVFGNGSANGKGKVKGEIVARVKEEVKVESGPLALKGESIGDIDSSDTTATTPTIPSTDSAIQQDLDEGGEVKPDAGTGGVGGMFRKRKGGGVAGRSVRQKT